MIMGKTGALLAMMGALMGTYAHAQDDINYQGDAEALLELIDTHYAYKDRFGGVNPARHAQGVDVESVSDSASLLDFAECALYALQDHHAIMGISSPRSLALTPSYNDLWIEGREGQLYVSDVRDASPAQQAGVQIGWQVLRIGDQDIDTAIDGLCGGPWTDDTARGFAARVLVAGHRHQMRNLQFRDLNGDIHTVSLTSLYDLPREETPPISVTTLEGDIRVLRFNDSLGQDDMVAAIDEALAGPHPKGIIIDLRDTASGGNTLVARALMGRLIDETQFYQRHSLPQMEWYYGVARQWAEEVTPRGQSLAGIPVVVLAGRWTGSMGEGLTMGLDQVADATIIGAPMAGLLGAITDNPLANTGWIVKLPTEKLFHVDGTPREDFVADIVLTSADERNDAGEDLALAQALAWFVNQD